MNQKKESILKQNINDFLNTLEELNNAYYNNNEIKINKLPCILERQATRAYTHYEDWTTINNDLKYINMIKQTVYNRLENITLHENLKSFIKEQQYIEGMMYYSYSLIYHAVYYNK